MKTAVTIRYVSGREEKFEVEFWGGAGAEARFKEFVRSPTVVLQTAGELLVMPATAIECISISLPEDPEDRVYLGNVRAAERLQ
jgi:hypothetical protein